MTPRRARARISGPLIGDPLDPISTTQSLHLVPGCFQRWPPQDPHQRFRLFLPVNLALPASRTGVSRLERFAPNRNSMRAGKSGSAVAPMSPRLPMAFWRCLLRSSFRIRRLRKHGTGLFGRAPPRPHPFDQGMDHRFQLLSIRWAQRGAHAVVDNLVYFLQIHIDRHVAGGRFHDLVFLIFGHLHSGEICRRGA